MNTNPLSVGHYASTNQLLLDMARCDIRDLIARWDDEAAEHALAGNPRRALYLNHLGTRLFGGGCDPVA